MPHMGLGAWVDPSNMGNLEKMYISISGVDVILLLYLSMSNLPSCSVSKFALPLVFEALEKCLLVCF
jgi:hypothetical protein